MPSAIRPIIKTQYMPLATGTLYTATSSPANAIVQITSIMICNVTAAAKTFNIYNVAVGGTASLANAIFGGNLIPANTTWIETVGGDGVEIFTLGAGDFIAADASSANAVTLTMGGKIYT